VQGIAHPSTVLPEAAVKIKLAPESLEVQTFVISAENLRERGTVQGHQLSRPIVQCYSNHSCVYPCTDDPAQCV
jgi:hypothetical protein